MSNFVFACVFLFLGGILCAPQRSVISKWTVYPNDRPIIGILAQEEKDKANSYIAASYVKFVEAGGARVVPIHNNETDDVLFELLDQINGVLLPGGGASLDTTLQTSFYAQDGARILQYAKKANDKKDYFPVWGTCLGFELMATLLTDHTDILVNCSSSNIALPLNMSKGATDGRLFGGLPTDVYQYLLNEDVTANFHHKCLTPETVVTTGLDKLIKVLSTNYDEKGLEFVSTFEAISYPFYGVQWHPEKAPWEWTTNETIPHSPDAIRVTQYFASFFANEGRKSVHKFKKPSREKAELIYNINPKYSAKGESNFEQIYEFGFKNAPKKSKKPTPPIVQPVIDHTNKATGSSGHRVFADHKLLATVFLLSVARYMAL